MKCLGCVKRRRRLSSFTWWLRGYRERDTRRSLRWRRPLKCDRLWSSKCWSLCSSGRFARDSCRWSRTCRFDRWYVASSSLSRGFPARNENRQTSSRFSQNQLTKFFLNEDLTDMMRSAISLTSRNHSALNSGELKIVLTMRAPWMGGFEYIGRMRILSWESVRSASSLPLVMSEKAPARSPYRPIFLA